MPSENIRAVTVLLEVFDMATSVAFYRALGAEVVQHWGERDEEWDWVFLRLGEAELMLNTAYERDRRPPAPDPAHVEAHADTELFFDCIDLDALCTQLRAAGILVPQPENTFYGTRRVCLKDADGFRVWFQSESRPPDPGA